MTKLLVDDQPMSLPVQSDESVSELIGRVDSALPPSRAILEVVLDGRPFHLARHERGNGSHLSSFTEIQIRTASKQSLSESGVENCFLSIQTLQKSVLFVAELIRNGRQKRAREQLCHCIDGLYRFLDLLHATCEATPIHLSSVKFENYPLSSIELQLNRILQRIQVDLEQGDFDSIANRIEYELLTNLHAWNQGLSQLAQKVTHQIDQ